MALRRGSPAWFGAFVTAACLAGCSPPDDGGGGPGDGHDRSGADGVDVADAVILDGDDGPCAAADCTARCEAAGYAAGECTAAGSCSCTSEPPPDAGDDATAPDGEDDVAAEDDAAAADEAARDDGGEDDARPPLPSRCGTDRSYIWIANSAEGTLSKLCTIDGVEMGRYVTSAQGATGDPSRTSVNLHGDMVVTNRNPASGPSSVTKFAAELEDCIDRSGDGVIQTSSGPTDVLAWGADECMLWNTILPDAGASLAIGARATAWDGLEDATTGLGGSVWIGAMTNGWVYKLEGETGTVVESVHVTNQPYGGAMDGVGNFWIVGGLCTVGACRLARVNTSTLAVDYFTVPCGYGIAVDAFDRVWTSGRSMTGSCVTRLNPGTGESVTYHAPGIAKFYRGIAVDNGGSVWVASTTGQVVQIRESDVTFVHEQDVGPEAVVGVAIDFQGKVWAVSQGGNEAEKIDPVTYAVEHFPVGLGPYTYSDMTGYQLRTVIFY